MVNHKLVIQGVFLDYGKKEILKDISFELSSGRVLSLIGPNGAGKSSCMRILADLVRPHKGYAALDNKKIKFSELRDYTGYYIEMPSFYKYMTARQNLSILQKIRPKGTHVDELIRLVGLEGADNKPIRKYSKGMKQRLGIAQALIGNPDFLVLDEPFDGLDPEVKHFLMDLVKKLSHDQNKGILISSHQLDDMVKLADDVVLISQGEVKLSGEIGTLLKQKQKVKFFFLDFPNKSVSDVFQGKGQVSINEEYIEATITPKEAEQLVRNLVKAGSAPYRIEHVNLLYDKYMALTK